MGKVATSKVSDGFLYKLLLEVGYKPEDAERLRTKAIWCATIGEALMDVSDSFINDAMEIFRQVGVKFKQEKKYHYNEARKAAKTLSYHMNAFTDEIFRGDIGIDSEDYSTDLYEIIKLVADHVKSRGDMEQIKRSIERRKFSWNIFYDKEE